jgi:hypothetical protein
MRRMPRIQLLHFQEYKKIKKQDRIEKILSAMQKAHLA